jgi:hypothetical protein
MLTDVASIKTFNLIFSIIEKEIPAELRDNPQVITKIIGKLASTITENGKLTTNKIGLFEDNAATKAIRDEITKQPSKQTTKPTEVKRKATAEEYQRERNIDKYKALTAVGRKEFKKPNNQLGL